MYFPELVMSAAQSLCCDCRRFWEIDFLRGIAVVMMIVFHSLYDLNFFHVYKMGLYSSFSLLFVYSIGCIFILLVGISLTLSYSKTRRVITKERDVWIKFLIRGLKIFVLGVVVTIVTWLFLGRGFVVFGVLHCIGLSIILAYPMLRYRYKNLVLGILFIFIGIFLKTMSFDFYFLLWLGFVPSSFYTVDYFPLLPWFGVVLLGIFLGNTLYSGYKRRFILRDLSMFRLVRAVCFFGSHSLVIYFLHQPILIALILLFIA